MHLKYIVSISSISVLSKIAMLKQPKKYPKSPKRLISKNSIYFILQKRLKNPNEISDCIKLSKELYTKVYKEKN